MTIKVKEVLVSYGVTQSTGIKYEFFRLDYGIRADVPEDMSPHEIEQALRKQLREQLLKAVQEEVKFWHDIK